MAQTLYASFNDASLAEKAAGALLDAGARQEDLSVVAHEDYQNRRDGVVSGTAARTGNAVESAGDRVAQAGDRTAAAASSAVGAAGTAARYDAAADQKAANADVRSGYAVNASDRDTTTTDAGKTEAAAKSGISTTTAGDAGSGAAKGAGIGLGVGVLGALASIFIPGIGLVLGGGALATAIGAAVGTTAAGAISGGALGYLKDQGVPDHVAQNYESAVKNGGALLSVHIPTGSLDSTSVAEILNKYGAANVGTY